LPNSIAFFDACFATWKLGATPQPVSAKLPKFELDQIIEVGNPKLVVGADPSAHPGVDDAAGRIRGRSNVVVGTAAGTHGHFVESDDVRLAVRAARN
jgi:acyl-coenzyme A synthetase/AMP-(fatty) acid ligase